MNKTAHFFWHGQLTLYEYNCIRSFVLKGFDVNVWSFQNLNIPSGAKLCSASDIVQEEKIHNFTMDGKKNSLAAFSDYFRLVLLKHESGWWFDADCICLRSVDEFNQLTKNSSFIVGKESEQYVNNAVIFSNSNVVTQLLHNAELLCTKLKNNFSWGEIGPKLLTSFVNENNLEITVLSEKYFYPIHYKDALTILDPNLTKLIEENTKHSYTLHLWNEVLRKKNVNKFIMPPDGSFLHQQFIK